LARPPDSRLTVSAFFSSFPNQAKALFAMRVLMGMLLAFVARGQDLGSGGCPTVACTTKPCPCACLGDVGLTTVAGLDSTGGSDSQSKSKLEVGENIYGPFEAGFSQEQDDIIAVLGCTTGKGYVDGGIDTSTSEAWMAKDCGVVLPRWEGTSYISLLRECGGHTSEYHFHEKLSCLYNATDPGHSTKVGEEKTGSTSLAKVPLYGKHESTNTTPSDLDACGCHFGVTPDSVGQVIYHCHVQDKAPFTFGCFGPDNDENGTEIPVTLAKCRSLYTTCQDDCNIVELDVPPTGIHLYHKWCPCYDSSNGSNVIVDTMPNQESCPSDSFAAGVSMTNVLLVACLGAAMFT